MDEFVLDGQVIPAAPEVAQFYEALLTSLEVRNGTRALRTILITSSLPEEGKTTVTLGLAWAAMSAAKRVLVVDADLRKPRIHQLLDLDNVHGVSDIVTASPEAGDVASMVIRRLPGPGGEEGRLGVVTSGERKKGLAAPGLLQRMIPALGTVSKDYDLVLVDSPPILAVSDALLMASAADGVMLIVKAGGTRAQDARRANERLRETNCHMLGVVMTHFVDDVHGDSHLPYQDYYTRG